MKLALLLLSSFLQINSHAFALREFDQAPKSTLHLKRVVYKFEKEDLLKSIRSFVKETRPSRLVGTPGHAKAVNFLYNKIKLSTAGENEILTIQEFEPEVEIAKNMYRDDLSEILKNKKNFSAPEIKKWTDFTNARIKHLDDLKNTKGKNIVWEKRGYESPNEVIIIGAHYDSIAYDKKNLSLLSNVAAPGADNNGSGVSIALSLIETLSELKLKKSVRVIFFDYQELGFLGSLAYAKSIIPEIKNGLKVFSYVDLLMLGHDTKLSDKNKRHGNMKAYFDSKESSLYQQQKNAVSTFLKLGEKSLAGVRFTEYEKSFKHGDAYSFSTLSIPAFTLTQDWENDFNQKRIHGPRDYVETLNFNTLYRSFLYITFATSSWALGL